VGEDAAELNLAMLEQSEDALNRLLTEIRDIVSQLSLDSELLNVMIIADASWPPQAVYKLSQLQKNELNMLSTNQLFSDLFVYLEKSEAVISANRLDKLDAQPLWIGDVPFGRKRKVALLAIAGWSRRRAAARQITGTAAATASSICCRPWRAATR